MNREEILAMTAGNKLDSCIAEWMSDCYHDWKGQNSSTGGLFLICSKCGDCRNSGLALPNQHYSTDITAAWLVVEKIRDSDRYNLKRMNEGYMEKGQFDSTFVDFCTELMKVLGLGVSAHSYPAILTLMRNISPEVICKAALLTRVEDNTTEHNPEPITDQCFSCLDKEPALTLMLMDPERYKDEDKTPSCRIYRLFCLNCGREITKYVTANTVAAVRELKDRLNAGRKTKLVEKGD